MRSKAPIHSDEAGCCRNWSVCRSASSRRRTFLPAALLFLILPAGALNVLVVGGSGRVGGSTVRWLQKYAARGEPALAGLSVSVGCRTRESYDAARRAGVVPDDGSVGYVPVDLDGGDGGLLAAVEGCGLVVHTAGPFQGRRDPALLRCCVERGVPYVDVCDEYELGEAAKELMGRAVERGVPAVVSAGIWPGVSALMAAEARGQLEAEAGGAGACDGIDFSFFTAGTGNAGPTIVSATFLLLATPALTFAGGRPREMEPWTERRDVDFGPGVGVKPIWLLDNPDVPTTASALGVANASSRFGTDPLPWNYLFGAMKALPRSLLYNRNAMQAFALFSEPIIRLVDRLVGATNAMRVDARTKDGKRVVTARIVHPDLEECVGLATAAFAVEALRGTVGPGVWYPAEMPQEARTSILEAAREDTISYTVPGME